MGPGQPRRAPRHARGGDGRGLQPDARNEPTRAAPAHGRLQRRCRRSRGDTAARGRRDPALLHERGGAGGSRRLHREAQTGLREVPAPTVIAEAAPRPGPLTVWWIGARPRTLVAAIVPVLVGASWAGRHAVSIPRSLLALLVAIALQIGVNYANDYFDGVSGVDTAARIGPRRLVASGLAPPRAVAAAAIVMVCIAALAGVVLALLTTPWLIAAGALSVLALALYSGGPKPYAASGLGEVAVFVFFGLVATCGTAFVQQDRLTAGVFWLAGPVGLLACALLMGHHLRDIPTDRAVGKRTVAVRLGAQRSRTLLIAVVVLALLLPTIGALGGALPWLVALTLVTIPLAVPPLQVVRTAQGRALVPALIGITRLQLVFGVLLAGA